ncbi:MAG: hypothetical protein IJY62_04175 [Clostridia bacterium]|nr:hypothetical protein [Clostridia bacterium]
MKRILNLFNSAIVQFILSTIPTLWFAYFAVFATQSSLLLDENGKLTIFSTVVNIAMLAIMLFFSILSLIEKSIQKNQQIKSDKIYNSILSGIDECSTVLRNKQVENLDLKDKKVLMADYRSAIYTIMGNLLHCLTEITQIERTSFVATYFFKQRGSQNWMSISSDDGYKGVKQSDLVKNEASVLYQLLLQSGNIFYSSKQKAKDEGRYVEDRRDVDQVAYNLPMGSIFGSNWTISDINGTIIFDNIITIATYGKEICTEKDAVTKRTIIETVLKIFRHQFIQTAFTYSLLERDTINVNETK